MRALALAAVLLIGCFDMDAYSDSQCPEQGTELSYENFGAAFVGDYCQSCHASDASNRQGAPTEFSFDTHESIRRHAERIYERSALGNTSMPPGPEDPATEERDALAEWLACGAP